MRLLTLHKLWKAEVGNKIGVEVDSYTTNYEINDANINFRGEEIKYSYSFRIFLNIWESLGEQFPIEL